tara:strand:+ start:1359 stop:1874 length:516 start_codon:yes stop_codon:yes gene_type:complete
MAVIEAIATTYLEADAATVTFGSIPATYEHLQLRGSVRSTEAVYAMRLKINLNGDTGSNYSNHILRGTGSSATAYRQTGVAYIQMSDGMHGSSMPAANYATFILDIVDYANTNKNTTCSFMAGSALGHTDNRVQFGSGLWDDTAAITTVLFTPNAGSFSRGSEFTLYGLND